LPTGSARERDQWIADVKLSDTPLGLAHFTVIEVPPLDLVGLAARIGYAAIGVRLHPAFPGAPTYKLPAGSAASREMRRRLGGEGVRVHDIEFVTIGGDFVPASLSGMLKAAGALGARRLSACGDDPDRSRLVANFAALCDLAAPFGIGVDLECMAWRIVSSLPLAVRVAETAERPNGGVLVDALHLSRTGGAPEDVRGVSPRLIRSAQLCDARAERPVGDEAIIRGARSERLAPGTGHLFLGALLAALPAHAALSVEVPMESGESAEEHALRVFDATRTFLARARGIGASVRAEVAHASL
jgi:sugar phosphate isomerase/epimerase